jgi:hypothetical protein
MGDTTEQDQAESDPARAFEALRAEVGALRRAMEALPEAWEEVRPPDYSSDLGRISKSLATAATKLEAMETHPALRLTPEQHQAAVARAAEGLMRDALQKLDRAAQEAERERHQLARLIGTVRDKRDQLFWLIALPVMVFALTLFASPILLGWLPFGWPSDVAAIVMGEDRWDAGWTLLRAADPAGEEQAAAGFNLVKANRKELAMCGDAAAKTKKDQHCLITIPAQ